MKLFGFALGGAEETPTRLPLFTDTEWDTLMAMPHISSHEKLDKIEGKAPQLTGRAKEAYERLQALNHFPIDSTDPDLQQYIKMVKEQKTVAESFGKPFVPERGVEYVRYADEGTIEVDADGYQFVSIPVGTKFYKGTPWFYRDLDTGKPDQQIWCGNRFIAMTYTLSYFGGMMVFRTRAPLRLFLLNRRNTERLLADPELPQAVRKAVEAWFGVHQSLYNRVLHVARANGTPESPAWVYRDFVGVEEARGEIMPTANIHNTLRESQHTVINYCSRRFGSSTGTLLPPHISPFRKAPNHEEVTLPPSVVEVLHDDPWSWETWGLNMARIAGPRGEFKAMEAIRNFCFRLSDWWLRPWAPLAPPDVAGSRGLLTWNLHGLRSVNELVSEAEMLRRVAELVDRVRPDVLVLQEVPRDRWRSIMKQCQFQGGFAVQNGGPNLQLVALTRRPAQFQEIRWREPQVMARGRDDVRGSILVRYQGLNIVAVHLAIGFRYGKRNLLAYPDEFAAKYPQNVARRCRQLEPLLAHRAHVIVGDMNFQREDPEADLVREKGYRFDTELEAELDAGFVVEATTIHGTKVDHVATAPGVHAQTQVLFNGESDHRPLWAWIARAGADGATGGADSATGGADGGAADEAPAAKVSTPGAALAIFWDWSAVVLAMVIVLVIVIGLYVVMQASGILATPVTSTATAPDQASSRLPAT